MALTLRSTKGSALTHAEMDANLLDFATGDGISGYHALQATVLGLSGSFCKFLNTSNEKVNSNILPANNVVEDWNFAIPPTTSYVLDYTLDLGTNLGVSGFIAALGVIGGSLGVDMNATIVCSSGAAGGGSQRTAAFINDGGLLVLTPGMFAGGDGVARINAWVRNNNSFLVTVQLNYSQVVSNVADTSIRKGSNLVAQVAIS